MASNSDSASTIELDDSVGFELTDLGSCSYLDPHPDSLFRTPERVVTDDLDAVSSAPTPARPDPESSSPTLGRQWIRPTTADPASGAGHDTALAPDFADRDDAWGVSASVPPSEPALDHPTVEQFPARPSGDPPDGDAASLPAQPESGTDDAADRLDEALAEFLGGPVPSRSPQEEFERLYGGVFDPDERARDARRAELDRLSTGAQVVAPSDDSGFAWDVDELDAPIDPEDIRRRVGRRATGSAIPTVPPRPEGGRASSESDGGESPDGG